MKGELAYFLMSCNGAVQFLLGLDKRSLTLRPGESYADLVGKAEDEMEAKAEETTTTTSLESFMTLE